MQMNECSFSNQLFVSQMDNYLNTLSQAEMPLVINSYVQTGMYT